MKEMSRITQKKKKKKKKKKKNSLFYSENLFKKSSDFRKMEIEYP